ncbi:MAG: hypothetical protein R2810_06410 [Flavobacteriales bacterium]
MFFVIFRRIVQEAGSRTPFAVFLGGGARTWRRHRLFLALDVRGAFPWAIANLLATGLLAWLVLRWQTDGPACEGARNLRPVTSVAAGTFASSATGLSAAEGLPR